MFVGMLFDLRYDLHGHSQCLTPFLQSSLPVLISLVPARRLHVSVDDTGGMLVSGLLGMVGQTFLTGLWLPSFELPLLGKVHLGTPVLFDIGVYLLVDFFRNIVCTVAVGAGRDQPEVHGLHVEGGRALRENTSRPVPVSGSHCAPQRLHELHRSSQVRDIAATLADDYHQRTGITPQIFASRPAEGAHLL